MTDTSSQTAPAAAIKAPMRGGFLQASAVNSLRSMLLCAGGALIGLGIAGYGLLTAAGTSTRSVPPENVATVNQRPILRSDFVTQLEAETGVHFDKASKADKLKVLDEMVREELLVQRGLELDFAETDQGTRNSLVAAISDQAIAEVTTSQPTEQQLRDFYDSHTGQWTTDGIVTLREMILPKTDAAAPATALSKAGQAASDLRGGAAVEAVISRYGLTESKHDDEEYYFFARFRLGEGLFADVIRLNDGEVSDPRLESDGIHIVKMIKNRRPVPTAFEIARAQVQRDYTDAAKRHLMDSTVKFLRSRAKILIADDYVKDYRP